MAETENKKSQNSSSHERKAVAYLRPCVEAKLEKYVETHGCSKSEAINDAILKLTEPITQQHKIIPK